MYCIAGVAVAVLATLWVAIRRSNQKYKALVKEIRDILDRPESEVDF